MKKSLADSRSDVELPLRLYRAVSDVVRHLDDQRARVEHVSDLFSESMETQRIKLRDYCDKLMFTDPVGYGKKAEDLLWRKVFYEIVGTVKRLNKSAKMDLAETFLIQTHLQSGIGYYHHIIMKLQSHFRLDLRGIVDFPLLITDSGLKKDKSWWIGKPIESGALEWAHNALHRCLIYLGDLCRYLSDLQIKQDHNFAQRYYLQALNWKPECGMPHNQLGTLSTFQNYGLDSAYYYMRCLSCIQKFDGADGNLLHLMENNYAAYEEMQKKDSVPNVQKLIVTVIQISCMMFYDKPDPEINQMCADVFTLLETCLVETDSKNVPTSLNPIHLNDDIIFKIMTISIMCVEQLQAKNSQQVMGGVALCLALMSQMVQTALKRLEEVLPPRRAPNSKKSQHRRRRRVKNVQSDLSEDENESVGSLDSDISEEDLVFDHEDLEDEPSNGNLGFENDVKVKVDATKPWRHSLVSNDKSFAHIFKLSQEGYLLQTIKVSFHWILSNQSFLKLCGPSSIPFITRLVDFLNHLGAVPNLASLKEVFDEDLITENELCTIPLPEDIAVRGLSSLQFSQSSLNWNYLRTKSLKPIDEAYIRVIDMCRFGKVLSKAQISVLTYDEKKQWFAASLENAPKNGVMHKVEQVDEKERKPQNGYRTGRKKNGLINAKNLNINGTENNNKTGAKSSEKHVRTPKINGVIKRESSKGSEETARVEKLMQNMGELWLRSEVSQLEDKTRKSFKESLPPYLVPDVEAFLNHPSLIKQLISAKKFIVLIPSIVVSALDECKQGSSKVRDTIRWLEWQLRIGERNIRIQRANEHQSLPFIKYPKKKDKEAWMFMQVVECCNYLCNQSTGEKNPELVTLLTGSKALLTTGQPTNGYSHISVAKSAGINVEHIEAFFSKWKSSSKSHG